VSLTADRASSRVRWRSRSSRVSLAARAVGANPDVPRHVDGVSGGGAAARACIGLRISPKSQVEGDAFLTSTNNLTLAGMLALSGVAAESMVQGRRLDDDGPSANGSNAGLGLDSTAACHLDERPEAQGQRQTITESTLIGVRVIRPSTRRRNPGTVSVAGRGRVGVVRHRESAVAGVTNSSGSG